MGFLSSKLRQSTEGIIFWCPGCDMAHQAWTETSNNLTGAKWSWNGNAQSPTISPSLNISLGATCPGHNPPPGVECRCHCIVTDGQIYFCSDSTHALSNQTVPMINWPSWEEDDYIESEL